MPKNEAEFKWTCKSCTYGNWPAAKRCCMCAARRTSPLPEIEDYSDKSSDIICSNDTNVCESIIPSNEKQSHLDKNLKWPCPSCSYLNWMKSENCVMCRSSKPNEFKIVESLRNIENNGEVKNNENKKDKSKVITVGKNHKWHCPKCTYENWPKAMKCVICQHQKNRNFKDDLLKNNDKNINEKNVRKKKTSSPRRSPPRSPNALLKQNSTNIFDIPPKEDERIIDIAMAMEKLNTKSDNQRLNQLRNRLTTKDWIWLAACKGVAEHDLSAVSKYINTGGDRTRQLTSDDVSLLNDPGQFDIGHTLVHLAIKYKREDILRMLLIPESPHRAAKKLPSHTCPETATTIRKLMAHSIRSRKGEFPCPSFTELVTFSLPDGKIYILFVCFLLFSLKSFEISVGEMYHNGSSRNLASDIKQI